MRRGTTHSAYLLPTFLGSTPSDWAMILANSTVSGGAMDAPPEAAASEQDGAFGARLRRAREAAGLAQEELAERAGLSVNTVGGLERGEHRHPHPATVRSLADALGLDDAERAALSAASSARGGGVWVGGV